MDKDNKSTEVNDTDKKLHISDVISSLQTDKYIEFRHAYEDHLMWCIDNNNSKRTTEEWHTEKAKDFYRRNLHNFFDND